MPLEMVGKTQLYYEVEGKGPPLILIAGYGNDLTSWETVRKPLTEHFQLILFDNRGMGRSACLKNSYTVNEMAEDVLELAEKLQLKRPHILGHSMGGAVAQTIAYKYPEKIGKSIIAQSFTTLGSVARYTLLNFLNLCREGVKLATATRTMLPWLLSDTWLNNPELCEFFVKLQVENPYKPLGKSLAQQCEALLQFDSQPWISKITTKPLVLAGSEDRLCPLKDTCTMAKSIPGAQLHVFEKVGHIAQIENPEAFCKVVTQFLWYSRLNLG